MDAQIFADTFNVYVAKDYNGDIYIYEKEPILEVSRWKSDDSYFCMSNIDYPCTCTWKDSLRSPSKNLIGKFGLFDNDKWGYLKSIKHDENGICWYVRQDDYMQFRSFIPIMPKSELETT